MHISEKKSNVFLLTRFNLKICKQTKNGLDARSDLWLKKRFELFEQFCYPSIKQQTFKDFIWVCLFADDTPQEYLSRIIELKSECPQLCPILMTEEEGVLHREMLSKFIFETKNADSKVITLRVDNDDILHKNFIEKAVCNSHNQQEDMAMYWFSKGLQFYSNPGLVFYVDYDKNQFPFLVNKNFKKGDPTILSYNHVNPEATCERHFIDGEPMWMENVHDSNVLNEIKFSTKQGPYNDSQNIKDAFLPLVDKDVCTHWYHWLTFLLPRMSKHFCVRLKMKILNEKYG